MASFARAVCLRLKELREEQELSIYRLSKLTGLSERSIGFIEKGERTPTIESVIRLSMALGVKLADVIREVEE